MNKKELITLIKTKASEVQIKDLTVSIMNRTKHLPEKEVIESAKPKFGFKSMYLALTGLLATVFILVIIYQMSPTPQPLNIDAFDESIAMSAISTASMMEASSEETATDINHQEQLIPPLLPSLRIVDEAEYLSRYLGTMEKLLSSDEAFGLIKTDINDHEFSKMISFRTKDLLNVESTYHIRYNQITQDENSFVLLGNLEVNTNIYQMVVSGEIDVHNKMVFRLYHHADFYIETLYEESETMTTYIIETYENDVLLEKVELIVDDQADERIVEIKFIEGSAVGYYRFNRMFENNSYILRAIYAIRGDSDETGELIISVVFNQTLGYQMLVLPDEGLPFMMNRIRYARNNPSQDTRF